MEDRAGSDIVPLLVALSTDPSDPPLGSLAEPSGCSRRIHQLTGSDVVSVFATGTTDPRAASGPLDFLNSIWVEYGTGSDIVSLCAALCAGSALSSATVVSLDSASGRLRIYFFTGSTVMSALSTHSANPSHSVT